MTHWATHRYESSRAIGEFVEFDEFFDEFRKFPVSPLLVNGNFLLINPLEPITVAAVRSGGGQNFLDADKHKVTPHRDHWQR